MEHDSFHGMNSVYDTDRQRRSLNGLPHVQPHFQDGSGQTGAQTLPPIHTQRYDYGNGSSDPQNRQQPSMYSSSAPSYSNYVAQPSHSNGYSYSFSHYPSGQTLLPSAPAMPMNQGYGTAVTSAYPQIRPMPASTTQAHSMHHTYAPSPSFTFPIGGDGVEVSPTHVVGSQGRRGILPSAEGKPAAVASNGTTGTKNTVIPQKDADGKFPCPHCSKTYLHGKHLKRHLLRHTGDRPYSCFLCNDTFSRSDILKRHFAKCSVRRGNPTGATHLSHSQNHLKKQAAKKPQTPAAINTTFPMNHHHNPHSASPIYHPGGLGVTISNSGAPSQPDGPTIANDGGAARDHGAYANSTVGFNRPNLNYLGGQNGPASLPSSGSSTPMTAKGPGHFHQAFGNDATPQRINPFTEANQGPGHPALSSSQYEGTNFDWANSPYGKKGLEDPTSQVDIRGLKTENSNAEMKPTKNES